jgi:hypothetical protein
MATFKDLQDRIALDYLNRYDMIPAVKRAINNAVKCYENQRWWFNETATSTTTTANSSQLGIPSDFLILDRLDLTYSGSRFKLVEDAYDCIAEMNATSATGVPTLYNYRGDRFELALTPDSAYTATIYYVHSLPALSADSDSNVWTNEAGNLIAHAACIDVLGSALNINDPRLLQKHERMLAMSLKEMHTRNATRLTTRLRATSF